MRLGILGGTFDPVHYGHLLLAESCREALRLDQLWFLPTAIPPHKQQRELAPPEARLDMLELAIAGHPDFSICRLEIDRGGVNYTVDTLAELKQQQPQAELFFLMGADSLRDLPGWKDPQRLCHLATPVIVRRAGVSDTNEEHEWSGMDGVVPAAQLESIRRHQVSMPRIDLSSSELRARVGAGHSIRYRTPRAVEMYILTRGLYRAAEAVAGQAAAASGSS